MTSAELETFARAVHEDGWAVTPAIIDNTTVDRLRTAVSVVAENGRGGARNLLELPTVAALATLPAVRSLATAVLGEKCFAVRALLFDKTPTANWKVIWHQDLTIATQRRADVAGYGPWSDKAGVPHVQPPVSILESMLAVRVHLDPCDAENGPVRVLDGSHRHGRLPAEAIDELRRGQSERDCCVVEGGVLAFRPLIVHASAPARVPKHRRVVHIEYAAQELPLPLAWHRSVA